MLKKQAILATTALFAQQAQAYDWTFLNCSQWHKDIDHDRDLINEILNLKPAKFIEAIDCMSQINTEKGSTDYWFEFKIFTTEDQYCEEDAEYFYVKYREYRKWTDTLCLVSQMDFLRMDSKKKCPNEK